MTKEFDFKGPVHKVVQRSSQQESWMSGLEHLPNRDSLDAEFSHAGKVIRVTEYTNSGAIHRVRLFNYDAAGRLCREIFLDATGNETGNTEFNYDEFGKDVGWLGRNAAGEIQRKGVNTYADGLLVCSTITQADDVPVLEKNFLYAGTTLHKSESKYYSTAGALAETWISNYNEQGLLAETFGLNGEGRPLGDGKYKYEYDDEKRVKAVLSFNDCAEEDVPNSIRVYEYRSDEHGNWVERRHYYRSRNDSRWTKRTTQRDIQYHPDA
jgi:hypothetical protein